MNMSPPGSVPTEFELDEGYQEKRPLLDRARIWAGALDQMPK
jgi:hypothetical protein